MLHRLRGNRRWINRRKMNHKKRLCESVWGDSDIYKKFVHMFDKGKIHDIETHKKTNQKPYKGKGYGNRMDAHWSQKNDRAGRNWSPSDRKRYDSTEFQLKVYKNHIEIEW